MIGALAPAAWYYLVAYEQEAAPASTWGAPTIQWHPYGYGPFYSEVPESQVMGAQLAHSKPYTRGAIRGYVWVNGAWQRAPNLDRDW